MLTFSFSVSDFQDNLLSLGKIIRSLPSKEIISLINIPRSPRTEARELPSMTAGSYDSCYFYDTERSGITEFENQFVSL